MKIIFLLLILTPLSLIAQSDIFTCDLVYIYPTQAYIPHQRTQYNRYDDDYDPCGDYDVDDGCSGTTTYLGGQFTYDACGAFNQYKNYQSNPKQTVVFYRLPDVGSSERNFTFCRDDFTTIKGPNNVTTACTCSGLTCLENQTCIGGVCTDYTYAWTSILSSSVLTNSYCGVFDTLICDYKCTRVYDSARGGYVSGNCSCVIKNINEFNKAMNSIVGKQYSMMGCLDDKGTKCSFPSIPNNITAPYVIGYKATGYFYYYQAFFSFWYNSAAYCKIDWIMGDKPLMEGDLFQQIIIANGGMGNWVIIIMVVLFCLM